MANHTLFGCDQHCTFLTAGLCNKSHALLLHWKRSCCLPDKCPDCKTHDVPLTKHFLSLPAMPGTQITVPGSQVQFILSNPSAPRDVLTVQHRAPLHSLLVVGEHGNAASEVLVAVILMRGVTGGCSSAASPQLLPPALLSDVPLQPAESTASCHQTATHTGLFFPHDRNVYREMSLAVVRVTSEDRRGADRSGASCHGGRRTAPLT